MLTNILDAWLHHWGWLWMLVGLLGYAVIVTVTDN